jgi:phospholipid-translocating ATPase
MYDPERDLPAEACNTAIAEDLGQIEWLLTDKTGTLTENVMQLKRFCVHGVVFDVDSESSTEQIRSLINNSSVGSSSGSNGALSSSPKGSPLLGAASLQQRELAERTTDFLRCLALCHSVTPLMGADGMTLNYQGPSPDEEALVSAASQLGVRYKGRDADDFLRLTVGDRQERYELLESLEFSSERRRMSVVVRSIADDQIWLFVKGADDVVMERCVVQSDASSSSGVRYQSKDRSPARATNFHNRTVAAVEEFASQGLRTLCIAGRQLSEQEYSCMLINI